MQHSKKIFFFFFVFLNLVLVNLRYHVPRSWLKPTENLLVLFEELGGDPTRISLVKRSVTSVCGDVAEFHPNIRNLQTDSYGRTEEFHKPKLHLRCSPGQSISSIKFASFGTPLGTCGNFQQGPCHAPSSHTILEKVSHFSVSLTLTTLLVRHPESRLYNWCWNHCRSV